LENASWGKDVDALLFNHGFAIVDTLAPTPSPSPPPGQRGYARETVHLSHHLEGTLLLYRGDRPLFACPCPAKNVPIDGLRTSPPRSKEKPRCPASGRPALVAVT
jgi:hypothetical protein